MIDSNYDASTGALVKEAIGEARELIRLEVALARSDVVAELTRVRFAAIALAVAAFAANVALAMALFALAAASHAEVVVAVVAAVVLFLIAGVAGATGYRRISASFLRRTRERIGQDIRELGERAHGT